MNGAGGRGRAHGTPRRVWRSWHWLLYGDRAASWSAQTDVIARSIGAVFVIAGVTGLISIAFPVASYGSVPLAVLVSIVACAIGVLLLAGLLDGRSLRAHMLVLALGTLIASVAVYAGGAPVSGAPFFYVWVT